MKKLFLIFLFLCLCPVVRGQEGCGEWRDAKPAWIDRSEGLDSVRLDGSIRHCTYYKFLWPNDLVPPDSVRDTLCGEWKYRWVKQECMRSLDLSGIETAVYREPDTCWQQEKYWIKIPCPKTERR